MCAGVPAGLAMRSCITLYKTFSSCVHATAPTWPSRRHHLSGLHHGDTSTRRVRMLSSSLQPDGLHSELLQLASSLLAHVPGLLTADHTKGMVQWAWRHLKREDSAVVSHALLTMCHLLGVIMSPEHVVHQVFNTMLKPGTFDLKRPVVRQALDLMMPILLQQRFMPDTSSLQQGGAAAAQQQREPRWVRLLSRALQEAQSGNTAVIWKTLLKQAHLLYPYRNFFVHSLVQTAIK